MAESTLTYTGKLSIVSCWCGIEHAIPRSLHECSKEDPKHVVYCPLGHQWVTSTSQVTRLRQQLDQEKAHSKWLADQKEAAERSVVALKGHATRMRKRAAAGVCPCCNRSFVNLGRHMAGQHPDYVEET